VTHRSRLTAVLVDVPAADHERAAAFWSSALGRPVNVPESNPEYAELGEVTPGVTFDVQAVDEPAARVHVDIETDDVEAEVARLVGLGATEVARPEGWVILHDPAGTVFCVVPVQLPESFEAHATRWD
jgi:predicted enzyme related to lactoylglutathione lyase